MAVMASVFIGPFMVVNGESGLVASPFKHTGYSIELSGDTFTANIRVYRCWNWWQPQAVGFEDFYVEAGAVPFSVTLRQGAEAESTSAGNFIPMQAMLASLYLNHEVLRPIVVFLQEFLQYLPINFCLEKRRDDGVNLIKPALAKAGFEVIGFFLYGRTISVQFGWVAPQDRANHDSRVNLYAAMVKYKPTPERALGSAHWIIPSPASIGNLLTRLVIEISRKEPVGLLSEAGKEAVLANFKWTRVSLLTAAEVKQARVEFVREHPELHYDPDALAKALKKAELYSDTAQMQAIKKQVPRLIQKAGRTGK